MQRFTGIAIRVFKQECQRTVRHRLQITHLLEQRMVKKLVSSPLLLRHVGRKLHLLIALLLNIIERLSECRNGAVAIQFEHHLVLWIEKDHGRGVTNINQIRQRLLSHLDLFIKGDFPIPLDVDRDDVKIFLNECPIRGVLEVFLTHLVAVRATTQMHKEDHMFALFCCLTHILANIEKALLEPVGMF